MQQSEVKNIANEVYRLTDTKLFALAFVRLRVLLKELQEWWAIQRCEELETLCAQMLKYSLGDYEDPHRDEIIAKLQADIYLLVDDIVDTITLRSAQYATHNSQSMNLERERLLNGDIFDTERSKALVDLFRNVWLCKRLSVDERNDIIAFVEDSGVELTARQMVVSALMLKCLRTYDRSVIAIFLNLLDEVEAQVRARVMVGLLMILALHSGRIERDSELSEQVKALFANERFSSDADKAYKHIINTFGTDKVTKKITTEIYPEIFKSGAKLHQMLKEEGGDAMNDDEFCPRLKYLRIYLCRNLFRNFICTKCIDNMLISLIYSPYIFIIFKQSLYPLLQYPIFLYPFSVNSQQHQHPNHSTRTQHRILTL